MIFSNESKILVENNKLLRDNKITLEAKRLYIILASLTVPGAYTTSWIAERNFITEDKVVFLLGELCGAGYLKMQNDGTITFQEEEE